MHSVVLAWQEIQRQHGRELALGEDLAFGYHCYLCKDQEEGIKEAGKFYEENLKMFGPLRLVRALSDQQIEDMADPKKAPTAGLPTIEGAIKSGGVLCGTPEQVIEHLKAIEAKYPGLDRVMVSQPVGTPEAVILEQMEWFAEAVMPEFETQTELAPAD